MPGEGNLEKARVLLGEAVKLDKSGRIDDAVNAYINGIGAMLDAKNEMLDRDKQTRFQKEIDAYLSRAETLKNGRPMKTEFLKQYRIEEDSWGHTYEKIFASCFDEKLTEVIVEDPYIVAHHQVMNFVMFCELLVIKCTMLKRIQLVTSPKTMDDALSELANSLRMHNIELNVRKCEFHDREIRFNNGWLVKIGRGLDIYKGIGKYTVGSHAFQLRPCKKTIVDIFKYA